MTKTLRSQRDRDIMHCSFILIKYEGAIITYFHPFILHTSVVAMGSPKGGGQGGGSVRTFIYNGSSWEPYGTAMAEGTGDATGYSVSLGGAGSTMAVGSPKASNNAGKVAVYFMGNSGDWELLGQEVYGEAGGDTDGTSVGISDDGRVLVVGGKGHKGLDTISGEVDAKLVGYCRIYKLQNDDWELQHSIVGKKTGEKLGSSCDVSSDGNLVACGGLGGLYGDSGASGVVQLYNMATFETSTLWPRGESSAIAGAAFGSSVALSADGGRIIAGAPTWSGSSVNGEGGGGPFVGAIQVFQRGG